jgi:hypothetical protein
MEPASRQLYLADSTRVWQLKFIGNIHPQHVKTSDVPTEGGVELTVGLSNKLWKAVLGVLRIVAEVPFEL